MPLLIAIEGPDKVGKATQTKLLDAALNVEPSRIVAPFEIPYNDANTYDKIYAMLKDGSAGQYPHAFQAFHAANRMVWQQEHLKKCQADVVLLDRWNPSSWVYGRAAGLSDEFLSSVLDHVRPADFVVVLDGKPMAEATDTYEADVEFMSTVRNGYHRWAKENSDRAVLVEANRPREVVQGEILAHVKRFLAS
jgi:thymidylate kinase